MKRPCLGLALWLFWCAPSFAGSCVIYNTLAPGASLPSEASCTAGIQYCREPEIVPLNQNDGTPSHYNSNQATPQPVPSYYYSYANLNGGTGNPVGTTADYAGVTGNFSGSTDDIARWAACKHGISENVIRAQMSNETHWNQNCPILRDATNVSCHESGDYNNPPGNTTGLPVTSITPGGVFSAYNGMGTHLVGSSFVPVTGTNHDASWSIVQNKVYYQWSWWPMLRDYTAFALDSRYAEMRSCMNGNFFSYFHAQNTAGGADYQTYVTAATSSPNSPVSGSPLGSKPSGYPGTETNIDYVTWGCFGAHLTGDWYGAGSGGETTNEKNYISAGYGYVVAGSFPTENGYASNPNDTQGTIPPPYTGPGPTTVSCSLCTQASTTNVSCPVPSGLVAGQLLVATPISTQAGSMTPASGWTNASLVAGGSICGQAISNGPAFIYLAYKQATSGDVSGGPFVFSWGGGFGSGGGICAYDYVGYSGGNPIDGGSGNIPCNSNSFSPSTTPTTPSITTGSAQSRVVVAYDSSLQSGASTITGPATATQRLTYSGAATNNYWLGDFVQVAAGATGTQAGTQTQNVQWNAMIFALLNGPAGGGGSTPIWPFP